MKSGAEKTDNIQMKFSYWKYKLSAVILSLLIVTFLVVVLHTFGHKPDPAGEAFFRQNAAKILRKDPNELNEKDYAKIIEFSSVNVIRSGQAWVFKTNDLSDIKPLEKFTNLQELDLRMMYPPENKFPKLVKILTKFGISDFKKSFVLDLRPLGKLIHLRELQLGGPSIKNIKPLSNLIKLTYLHLVDAPVSDLEPIKELSNLECLDFSNIEISDLEPIKGLEKLKIFYIKDCKNISDEELDDLHKALPNLEIVRYK